MIQTITPRKRVKADHATKTMARSQKKKTAAQGRYDDMPPLEEVPRRKLAKTFK